VLPVLVRFDGRPEVSETGNIIYVFPSMQVSAAGSFVAGLPAFMRELEWQFSEAPPEALAPIFILALINFLGAWWLFLNMIPLMLVGLAPLLIPLVIYGTFFVGLPLARYVAIQYLNGGIRKRNAARMGFARRLESPEQGLRVKLSEARQYKIEDRTVSADDIVYTTEKETLFQKDLDLEEFDKQLGKPENAAAGGKPEDAASGDQPLEDNLPDDRKPDFEPGSGGTIDLKQKKKEPQE